SHLFGGEETLLADLISRLDRFGLPARLAIADTAGAAWALARFHPDDVAILPSGQEAEALAPLPVAALRLSPDTSATLLAVGLKRVRALIDYPGALVGARLQGPPVTPLAHALGHVPE